MDDFDLIIDELGGEDTEEKTWMCEDCNLEDIDSDETKCPRCGFRAQEPPRQIRSRRRVR
jgi:rubrerythrin